MRPRYWCRLASIAGNICRASYLLILNNLLWCHSLRNIPTGDLERSAGHQQNTIFDLRWTHFRSQCTHVVTTHRAPARRTIWPTVQAFQAEMNTRNYTFCPSAGHQSGAALGWWYTDVQLWYTIELLQRQPNEHSHWSRQSADIGIKQCLDCDMPISIKAKHEHTSRQSAWPHRKAVRRLWHTHIMLQCTHEPSLTVYWPKQEAVLGLWIGHVRSLQNPNEHMQRSSRFAESDAVQTLRHADVWADPFRRPALLWKVCWTLKIARYEQHYCQSAISIVSTNKTILKQRNMHVLRPLSSLWNSANPFRAAKAIIPSRQKTNKKSISWQLQCCSAFSCICIDFALQKNISRNFSSKRLYEWLNPIQM